MRLLWILVFLGGLIAFSDLALVAADDVPSLAMVRDAGARPHPRVLLTDARVQELRELAAVDTRYQAALQALLARAQLYLAKAPVQDSADWNIWRETVARVYIYGFCYRYTGEEVYASALRTVLLTVADFPNWHDEASFLDTAEMAHAMAIGYDWLFGYLNDEERVKIREAIVQKGLQPGLAAYEGRARVHWWTRSDHNWNLVCNSGMILGALALDAGDAELATSVLGHAVRSMRFALPTYAPDGAWLEGSSYWEYATRYLVLALAGLDTAFASDFSMSASPGLATTWQYPVYFTAPNVPLVFAYADTLDHRWNVPFVFWLAARYDDEQAAASARDYFGKPHPWWSDMANEVRDPRFAINRMLDLLWYLPPPADAQVDPLPLDVLMKGKAIELASFRGSWDDGKALCVFVKAGANGALANHGHCDAGHFDVYALGNGGIRWASDTKKGPYLDGFFDVGTVEKPGKRWTYPITSAFNHNVLVLNNENQNPFAVAPVTGFGSSPEFSFVTIDLSPVYRAKAVVRGVAMLEKRQVVVQDELTLDEPTDIAWGFNSDTDIAVDGHRALLSKWGQKLQVTILSPAEASFDAVEVNKRRLSFKLAQQQGDVRIVVLFSPLWPNEEPRPAPDIRPLAEWKVEEVEE